jgi:hypothetical protein
LRRSSQINATIGPSHRLPHQLQLSAQQNIAKAESDRGWLSSWSLPFWNSTDNGNVYINRDGTKLNPGQQIRHIPSSSPLTNRQTPPELINYHVTRSGLRHDQEHLSRTGPLDREQQALFRQQQHDDDFGPNQLAPGPRRYRPQTTTLPSSSSLLTDAITFKSKLFDSDHMYRHWQDTDEIDKLTDQAWEHLERYGTASGQQHRLHRVDTPIQIENFITRRYFDRKRPPDPYELDPFENDQERPRFLQDGAHRYEPGPPSPF